MYRQLSTYKITHAIVEIRILDATLAQNDIRILDAYSCSKRYVACFTKVIVAWFSLQIGSKKEVLNLFSTTPPFE